MFRVCNQICSQNRVLDFTGETGSSCANVGPFPHKKEPEKTGEGDMRGENQVKEQFSLRRYFLGENKGTKGKK